MAADRLQFLVGYWMETSSPYHMGLSIRLLTIRLASPRVREWLPTSVFLPGEFRGQRNLVGYIQSMGSKRVGHD